MKNKSRIIALLLSICMLLSVQSAVFAAADPAFGFASLMNWSGDEKIPNVATTVLVNSMRVKEFNGENVIQVVGMDNAGKLAAGRQINYWTMSDNKSLGKRLSYEVYIPEKAYYVSMRGCYTRFESETIAGAGNNIGYNFETIYASNLTSGGYVTTVTFNNGDTSTIKGEKSIKNGEWHKVDIFVCDKLTHLYIDGEYIGTADAAFDKAINPGFDHAFKGFQMLPGKNGSTDVPGEDSGIYLRNILLTTYDYVGESFAGVCEQDGKKLTVTFSETPAKGQDISGIALYNTETGEKLTIKNPVLNDSILTLDVTSDFVNGAEYVIDMPDGFKSIRGTELYADIYFIGKATNEKLYTFEDYATDTDTTDAGKVTAITSGIGKAVTYKNFISAVDTWPESGVVGFEKQNGSTVLAVRDVPSNPRRNKDIRFGITTDEVLDLSEGPVTAEFDIMLPKLLGIHAFDIMPYAYNTSVAAKPELEVNYGGLNSSYSFDGPNTSYSMLQAPSVNCRDTAKSQETSLKFNVRADGKMVHQAGMDGNNNYYHSRDYAEGEWVKLKFVISKNDDGTYTTEWYLDGTYFGKQTNVHQADATDLFRGIRFGMYYPAGAPTECVDLAYIDNFKVSQSSLGARVTKVRIINRDGEDFAMLSEGASATADRAEVYFGSQLDYSGAVVTLEDESGDTVTTKWVYDASANKLVATLDSLLKASAKYTVKVTGLKTTGGGNIDDFAASFKTSDKAEFIIDLKITDADGNEITDVSALNANDKVYVDANVINTTADDKSVMFSITTYNNNSMKDMNGKEFAVGAGEKLSIGSADSEPIAALVKEIRSLSVGAYAWETISKIKPIRRAVIID